MIYFQNRLENWEICLGALLKHFVDSRPNSTPKLRQGLLYDGREMQVLGKVVENESKPSEQRRAKNACTQANTEPNCQLFLVFAIEAIKHVS